MSADRSLSGSATGPLPGILDSARDIRRGAISSVSLTEQCLSRIAGRDGTVNAFIAVLADRARAEARQADTELAAGRDRA